MKRAAGWTCASMLSVLLSAGCYTYVPVDAPRPGMDVRARLKTEAAVRRSQGLDEPVLRVDGTVVEATPEAIRLNVLVARSSSTFQEIVLRDTVKLETIEIQSLMVRQFSPGRTALVTVGSVAAAAALIAGIEQVVGGTGETPDPPDPTFAPRLLSWQTLKLLFNARRGFP